MNEIIDITEVEKQFKNEWLLFEVLETGIHNQPIKGRLICHHPDRDPNGPPTSHPQFKGCLKCHNDKT